MKKIRLGIFGGGTVGGGVFQILENRKKFFAENNLEFEIAKLCVRDAKKSRDFAIPKNTKITENPDEILDDEKIDIFVELIGGTEIAEKIIFAALEKKKSVVTANKAAIAKNLEKISEILQKNSAANFGFEAAVAGGIPIISAINSHFLIDEISQISGILNGTTNFILSKMEKENADFSAVLKEAQKLGFAEADPTADVDGFDARAKILILAALSQNFFADEKKISCRGISRVQKIDFEYAKFLHSTIKLLAVAQKNKNKISIFVSPAVVNFKNEIAKIGGATNAIEINSQNLQKSFLAGPGAGRRPTANSVVADIFRIAKNLNSPAGKIFSANKNLQFEPDFSAKFFVRFFVRDQFGIIKKVGEICEKNRISIDSILQLPHENSQKLPFVLTTEIANFSQIEKMTAEISAEKFCCEPPFFLPIL